MCLGITRLIAELGAEPAQVRTEMGLAFDDGMAVLGQDRPAPGILAFSLFFVGIVLAIEFLLLAPLERRLRRPA